MCCDVARKRSADLATGHSDADFEMYSQTLDVVTEQLSWSGGFIYITDTKKTRDRYG